MSDIDNLDGMDDIRLYFTIKWHKTLSGYK